MAGNWDSFDGLLNKRVDDVALVASVLFGSDGVDVPHIATPETPWPLAPFARPPRIAHLVTAVDQRMSASQRALMDATAARVEVCLRRLNSRMTRAT